MEILNELYINYEKVIITVVLICTLSAFLFSKWRYDLVSLVALFSVTLLGLLPPSEFFLGFINPVVIIVMAMLIISRAFINAGIVDAITRKMSLFERFVSVQLFILLFLVVLTSAFINNIGALALFIPVAIRIAKKKNLSPASFILPVAFASHMGGYITLIGASQNLIVASARVEAGLPSFGVFDFSPVGIGISFVAILFMAFVGWRLVPKRISTSKEVVEMDKNYLSEIHVSKESPFIGKSITDLEGEIKEYFVVHKIIRNNHYIPDPSAYIVIQEGDVLVVQADSDVLTSLVDIGKFSLLSPAEQRQTEEASDLSTVEVIISPDSKMIGRTAREIKLNRVYGVSLLALHRDGRAVETRIQNSRFKAGDILLLQGPSAMVNTLITSVEWYPLAGRDLRVSPSRMFGVLVIFGAAVIISVLNLFETHLVFLGAALVLVFMNYVPVDKLYKSIDGALIVLIGSMLQLGVVFERTGLAGDVASGFLRLADITTPFIMLGIILVSTMLLSELLNSATVAVLMASIAVLVAEGIGVSIDPFLIAVAIGAGSSYLTPIGHQSNTLVMNIGGYKFGDYWRLGLPLQIIIVIVALPIIARMWPL